MGGISNRMKEIKRRRHRRHKLVKFHSKLKKATTSEKLVMAQKLRSYQVTSTNISTHVDPSSARMSTYIGTNAEPVRSPLCLLLFFFLMYL